VAEQAAILSRVLGKPIQLVDITPEAAGERLRAMGGSDVLVRGLVAMWTAVRAGKMAIASDAVQRIVGRPAQNFEAFCTEHKTAFGA
jgi:hypothetical protein